MKTDEKNWAAWEQACADEEAVMVELGYDADCAVVCLHTRELRDLIADLRELTSEPVCPECGSNRINVGKLDDMRWAKCADCTWYGPEETSASAALSHARRP